MQSEDRMEPPDRDPDRPDLPAAPRPAVPPGSAPPPPVPPLPAPAPAEPPAPDPQPAPEPDPGRDRRLRRIGLAVGAGGYVLVGLWLLSFEFGQDVDPVGRQLGWGVVGFWMLAIATPTLVAVGAVLTSRRRYRPLGSGMMIGSIVAMTCFGCLALAIVGSGG